MLSVKKISNGFLIEVRAPYKPKKGKEDETMFMNHGEKEVFAKDASELGKKIEALMPLLEEEVFDSEDDFEKAFKATAG